MMVCKVIHPTEATMTNHSETHKVEVLQEEYMGKMKIQHKEVSIGMESILGAVGRLNLCTLYQIRMELSKY